MTQKVAPVIHPHIFHYMSSNFDSPVQVINDINYYLDKILMSGEEGPDFYSLMMNYTSKLKIRLKIPVTLIKEKDSPPVLLYTDQKSRVVRLVDPA